MLEFFLKHKDVELGKLYFQEETGYLVSASLSEETKKYLPYRALYGFKDLALWWSERAVPKTRKYFKEFLRENNIPTTEQYLLNNLALSLTDCYWVCPKGSRLLFDEVNFYDNNFAYPSEIENTVNSSFTPNASTGGELAKWWIINNGERYLLKGNAEGLVQQCYNEVFASKIHKSQDFKEYVDYKLSTLPNNLIGTMCKAFTSKNFEFISAWELIGKSDLGNQLSLKTLFISKCTENGLKESYVSDFLDYMALTDVLISNIDRHLNNFGVLRNSDTLEFKSMAPIFDNGNSMSYKENLNINFKSVLNDKYNGFYHTTENIIKHIRNVNLLDLDKLPSNEELLDLYSKDPRNMASNLVRLYEMKKNLIRSVQAGKSYHQIVSDIGKGRTVE